MSERKETSESMSALPVGTLIFFAIYALLFPGIIFLVAGTFQWPMGWWYYGASVVATILGRLIVARINPDQLIERGRSLSAKNAKDWDQTLSKLVGLLIPVITLVVIGLDKRWSWSPPLPSWVAPLSLIFLILGYALGTWAFVANRFFSGVVRIQEDRGHYVVTDGPYRFVRHPGYLGGLFSIIATPFMLGSLWALIPVALYIVAMVLRTSLEDRTLLEELPGYTEYAARTRFRLIPSIW